MTGPPGTGDDDPVAQFSDPELRHGYPELSQGYPEYPTQQPGQGGLPGPSAPAGGSTYWGPAEAPDPRRSSRRRLIALLIVVLIAAVAAGLVAGLAH